MVKRQKGIRMDLRRIRHFLTLAQTLNFSEAARRCGISQPALSKSVRRLEEELGGRLIRREGRLTHLTHLGRAMVQHLGEVARAAEAADAEARRFTRGTAQPLKIAVMCTVGPARLSGFMRGFLAEHPDVVLTLHDATASRITAELLEGRVDLALIGAPTGESQRLRHTELYTEDMVMACAAGHPYARRDAVTLQDLAREPYLDRLHCEFRDTFLAAAMREKAPMRVVLSSEREDWIQSLVRAGQGITILPRGSVMQEGIATVPVRRDNMQRSVLLALATGREDTPAVRAFMAAARRHDWAQDAGRHGAATTP